MDSRNKILLAMGAAGQEATMDVIRRYLVHNTKARHAHLISMIADNTIEPVEVEDGARLTPDGRVVFWFANQPWVLKKEAHAERLAQAFKAAKQAAQEAETKSVVGTESLSAMVCPKCGDALQHTTICPKCAAGKLGYRHRYTCVCGGVDLVSKEAL